MSEKHVKLKRPLLNKRKFSLSFFFIILTSSFFYFNLLYLFVVFILFEKIYSCGKIPKLNRFFYEYKRKKESKIFKDNYYIYFNNLEEYCGFYKNLIHNEEIIILNSDHNDLYYLGKKIDIHKRISVYREDYYSYLIKTDNIDIESQFFNYICNEDIENINALLKKEKIEINHIHFKLAAQIKVGFDTFLVLFNNKNYDILYEDITSLFFNLLISKDDKFFIFLMNYVLNDIELKSKFLSKLISLFFIYKKNKEAYLLLNKIENTNYIDKESEKIFLYFYENNSNKENEIIKIFSYKNLINKLSENFKSCYMFQNLDFDIYKEKAKIYNQINNF